MDQQTEHLLPNRTPILKRCEERLRELLNQPSTVEQNINFMKQEPVIYRLSRAPAYNEAITFLNQLLELLGLIWQHKHVKD